eukprot:6211160-Pleurochrysis_carterae.AAC.1
MALRLSHCATPLTLRHAVRGECFATKVREVSRLRRRRKASIVTSLELAGAEKEAKERRIRENCEGMTA